MTTANPLIALEPEQFDDLNTIRTIVLKEGVRPAVEVGSRRPRPKGVARVMNVGDEFPVYSPLTVRQVALFQLSRETNQDVVQFFGEDLHGLVRLTVGDISIEIDCRASTAELRAALGIPLQDCRVTVFPGLWEFAWGDGINRRPITCAPVAAELANYCMAGIVIRQEGWRSTSADGDGFALVNLIDGIPFIEGELKRGAVSIASAIGDGLWIAHHWSCPAVTYRIN